MDHTDHATFVLFDRDASSLFNMSCEQMIHSAQKHGGVPPQIANLVDNTWLFKVETKPSSNPRFEQTFRVRKICTDGAIVQMFKDKWDGVDDSISKSLNEVGSLSTLIVKGKDALVCGSTNVLSEDSLSLTGSSVKGNGKDKVIETSDIGLSQDLMKKFSTTVVNLDDDSSFTQYISKPTKAASSSKDLHPCSGSGLKLKGQDIDSRVIIEL